MFRAMARPGASQVLTACVLLALLGCGRSQESKIVHAIDQAFPGGQRRCLNLAGASVGIHVAAEPGETLWFPSAGVTSPVNHMFVFWSARSDAPVPELVADFAGRGILTKATVTATVDAESSQLGPQTVSRGYYFHPTLYRHRTASFPVDVYTTEVFDDAFGYTLQIQAGSTSGQGASFPSRLYDIKLPPPDSHYLIPTTTPYAISVVTSACFRETPDGVVAVRIKDNLLGTHYMEADVRFGQHPPKWMLTHAFQRAAIGPDTPSITKPRSATVILAMDGEEPTYVREESRW